MFGGRFSGKRDIFTQLITWQLIYCNAKVNRPYGVSVNLVVLEPICVFFFFWISPRFDLIILSSVIYCVFCVWHINFRLMCTVHTLLDSRYCVCVCACVCYNKACSSEETDTARYLGGDPYGRSQSDVDGITATLVLMRSSLALMSDRMTVRDGPHGRQPGWQSSRQAQTHI